jgi:3'(2'), 5'-bisphosphate nucleotidase
MQFALERQAALEAVRLASHVCLAVQRRWVAGATLSKGDKSPVTVADYAAQAVVSHLLARRFPHVPLVGEEDAAALRANPELAAKVLAAVQTVSPELDLETALAAIDRGVHEGGPEGSFWVLDPIDGTKGFLRQEQYAVALALIVDGQVVLGALGCPNLPDGRGGVGCVQLAVLGQGAVQTGLQGDQEWPLAVDGLTEAHQARFTESVEAGHSDQDQSVQIAQRLGITQPAARMDSQCKYAVLARGEASIYLRLPTRADYVERIWDHAAGYRVVLEAGGQVSDVLGRPLDFSLGRGLAANKGVVVTNGALHAAVIDAVRQVLTLP